MTEDISKFWRTTWLAWRAGELSSLSDEYVESASIDFSDFLSDDKYAKNPLFLSFLEKNLPWQEEFLITLMHSGKVISLVLTSQRVWMLDNETKEHVCLHWKDVKTVTIKSGWNSHTATVIFKDKSEKIFKNLNNVPADNYIEFVLKKSCSAEGWRPKVAVPENPELKKNVDLILMSITKEPVLAYAFGHWKIVKQKAEGQTLKKISGLVAGVALGGLGGEMIFGGTLLSNPDYVYTGELGVVAVTKEKIYVRYLTTPFRSEKGDLFLDHFKLLAQQISSDKITEKIFSVQQTQVSMIGKALHLVGGDEYTTLSPSQLFVDGGIYSIPEISEVYRHLASRGALCGESEFLKKLAEGENPITQEQFAGLEKKDGCIERIYIALFNAPQRDELAKKISFAIPAVQSALVEHIQNKASACPGTFKNLLVWIVFFLATIYGAIYLEGVVRVVCIVGVIITLFGSLARYFDWKESRWCQGLIEKKIIQ